MKLTARVDAEALKRALARRGDKLPELAEALVAGSIALHQREMRSRLRGRSTGSNNLRRRTGALARSLRGSVNTGRVISGSSRIGRGAPHARIHEDGGKIRAKKRFLTIPMRAARTAAKVTRKGAELVQQGGKWQTRRKLPGAAGRDTFIFERRGRKFVAVERHGGGALPVYLLRRQVTIPARLGFSKTFRGQRAKRRALYARKLRQWAREAK